MSFFFFFCQRRERCRENRKLCESEPEGLSQSIYLNLRPSRTEFESCSSVKTRFPINCNLSHKRSREICYTKRLGDALASGVGVACPNGSSLVASPIMAPLKRLSKNRWNKKRKREKYVANTFLPLNRLQFPIIAKWPTRFIPKLF